MLSNLFRRSNTINRSIYILKRNKNIHKIFYKTQREVEKKKIEYKVFAVKFENNKIYYKTLY